MSRNQSKNNLDKLTEIALTKSWPQTLINEKGKQGKATNANYQQDGINKELYTLLQAKITCLPAYFVEVLLLLSENQGA
jgi:hypothetical protein